MCSAVSSKSETSSAFRTSTDLPASRAVANWLRKSGSPRSKDFTSVESGPGVSAIAARRRTKYSSCHSLFSPFLSGRKGRIVLWPDCHLMIGVCSSTYFPTMPSTRSRGSCGGGGGAANRCSEVSSNECKKLTYMMTGEALPARAQRPCRSHHLQSSFSWGILDCHQRTLTVVQGWFN